MSIFCISCVQIFNLMNNINDSNVTTIRPATTALCFCLAAQHHITHVGPVVIISVAFR